MVICRLLSSVRVTSMEVPALYSFTISLMVAEEPFSVMVVPPDASM